MASVRVRVVARVRIRDRVSTAQIVDLWNAQDNLYNAQHSL